MFWKKAVKNVTVVDIVCANLKDDRIKFVQKFAVVYFPSINLDKINTIRKKYDPSWNLIPPHITLVSPLSDISGNQLLEHIDTISKNFRPFSIHLTGLTKSFDDYLQETTFHPKGAGSNFF